MRARPQYDEAHDLNARGERICSITDERLTQVLYRELLVHVRDCGAQSPLQNDVHHLDNAGRDDRHSGQAYVVELVDEKNMKSLRSYHQSALQRRSCAISVSSRIEDRIAYNMQLRS